MVQNYHVQKYNVRCLGKYQNTFEIMLKDLLQIPASEFEIYIYHLRIDVYASGVK